MKSAWKISRRLVPLVLLGLLGGCEDLGPSGPKGPGLVRVGLSSPNGAEGSAVFEVTGNPGMGSITSPGADVYYSHGLEGTRVVVILDTPGQIGFQIQVQEIRDLPSVVVTQVADGSDQLRSSLGGYDVEVFPVEDGGSE